MTEKAHTPTDREKIFKKTHTPTDHEKNNEKYMKIFDLFKNSGIRLSFDDSEKKLLLDKYTIYYSNKIATMQTLEELFINKSYYFETNKVNPFIIDAGSEVGIATIFFKIFYPQSEILCFEPHPYAFSVLQKNIMTNKLENVTVINAALADHEGMIDFFGEINSTDPDVRGCSIIEAWGLQRDTCSKVRVKAVKLSKYITHEIDYLKLDVEGAEQQVLEDLKDKMDLIDKMGIEFHYSKKTATTNSLDFICNLLPKMGFLIKNKIYKKIIHDPILFPSSTTSWVDENDIQLCSLLAEKKAENKSPICFENTADLLQKKILSLNIHSLEKEIFLLRNIIDNIPSSIYWKDKVGTHLGRSAYAAQQLRDTGIDPNATIYNIAGKSDYDIFTKEIADKYRENDLCVMENNNEFVLEENIVMPNGKERAQLSSKKPLYDADGNIVGIIGCTIDITDRKRAKELELENALQKTKLEEHEKFKSVAKQVAHDIRSPLAALDHMMGRVTRLPEEDRLIIRNATQRINDIANNLLSRYSGQTEDDNKTAELFITLLESIISEKRIQYAKMPIVLTISSSNEARGLFADVDLSEFKRVLSNIINNAVEAFDNNGGKIDLVLSQNQNNILLSIIDNGKGISKGKLSEIFAAKSSDKKGGHGLGLPYAKECIEKWHGQIAIESMEGLGATVKISLPKACAPKWFVSEININEGDTLVVLDDDNSIHDVWRSRLEQLGNNLKNILRKDFLTSDSLIQWYLVGNHARSANHSEQACLFPTDILFLIDYELIGHKLTGLDVIEQLNIADQSILVTSRFEDPKIRERCEKLGLKMIPKSFSPYIPIEFCAKNIAPDIKTLSDFPDCVFLDDDTNTTQMWSRVAEDCGKQIKVFNNTKEFKKYVQQCPKDMLIYLDSDLGYGANGEDVAKELHELGYNNIYLATGHNANNFRHVTWIKGVVGKKPPFSL